MKKMRESKNIKVYNFTLLEFLRSHISWLKSTVYGQQLILKNIDLSNVNLAVANLQQADLEGANLQGSDLQGANMHKINLKGANLSAANLRRANLSEANLSDIRLINADLTGVKFNQVVTFGWNIKGVKCDFIYLDIKGYMRYPADRNFEPGEFEKIYGHLPTFEEKAALSEEISKLQKKLTELESFSMDASKSGGIFISHSHADKDVVSLLTSRFDKEGIQYWLDEKEMLIGQVIDKAISEGIQKSWLFLILLTPSSITSKWVEREFDEASHEEVEGGKIILPAIAKGLTIENLPSRIRRKLCVNLTTDFEKGYAILHKSILKYLSDFAAKRNAEKQELGR